MAKEFLAAIDRDRDSVAALDRRKHVEPYLTSLVDTVIPAFEQQMQ